MNIEFCFGRTGAGYQHIHSIENRMLLLFSLLSLVTTLKTFSVSWITIPDRPTIQGFLLWETTSDVNIHHQLRLINALVMIEPWKSALRSFGCIPEALGICLAADSRVMTWVGF